jgi:hypothetical protein
MEDKISKEKYFLYIITCNFRKYSFMKIGKTKDLEGRIKNIQTGCPHKIKNVFIISSEFDEEINGLEHCCHYFFKPFCTNNEWYLINKNFMKYFLEIFNKINSNDFPFDEIEYISDEINFDSLEILFHHHDYIFQEVKKINGKYTGINILNFNEFCQKVIYKDNFLVKFIYNVKCRLMR